MFRLDPGAMEGPPEGEAAEQGAEEQSWVSWEHFLGVDGGGVEIAGGGVGRRERSPDISLNAMKKKSVKTMRNLSKYISAAEKDSGDRFVQNLRLSI